MTPKEQLAIVKGLRCVDCGKKPSAHEAAEMVEKIGPVLSPLKPGERLMRRCRPCMLKGDN